MTQARLVAEKIPIIGKICDADSVVLKAHHGLALENSTVYCHRSEMTMSYDNMNKIPATLARYASGWCEGNIEKILALWDEEYAEISYMPAELDAAVTGHASMRKYYNDVASAFSVSRGKIGEVTVRPLGDVVYAICDFDWEFKHGDAVIALPTRATFVLRERRGEWYFLHMHESIVWKPAG